jgi:hypothetical protein
MLHFDRSLEGKSRGNSLNGFRVMRVRKAMENQITEQRSSFVTAVAWLSIVGAGSLSAFFGAGSIIAFKYFPPFAFPSTISPNAAEFNRIRESIFDLRLIYLMCFGLSVITLIVAIELLRRRNWARIGLVTIMSALIATQIGLLMYQLLMFVSASDRAAGAAIESVTVVAGAIVLLAWVVKRLTSAPIKAEFR